MKKYTFGLLQLFAQGSGGEASASGDGAAAAGQENRAQPDHPAPQVAAAQASPGRMTWEQVKADPEYSEHMQAMVRERVKNIKQAQSDLQTLAPALEVMAREHGLDPANPDYAALTRAVTARQNQSRDREAVLQKHFSSLVDQGRALQQKYPGFQLQRELQNPTFARLTAPGTGISVEDAYYTVHRKEIENAALQVTAQKTAQRISNAIRAGGGRPEENGTSAHGPSVSAFDYRTASREQREALKLRIRQAGARGEKIYPGVL